MRISDLWTPDSDVSANLFWYSVGNLIASVAFLFEVYVRGLTEGIFLIYIGAVAGSAVASKLISYKFNAKTGESVASITNIQKDNPK